MKYIDLAEHTGFDACKWCVSDFYPEAEKTLRETLASGEDFDTYEYSCKKEIHYGRITRENGEIVVSVRCYMDDLWEQTDLIYDALWDVADEETELSDETIEVIREAALDDGIDDSSVRAEALSAAATFDDIVAALNRCESAAEAKNDEMYKRLCEIVAAEVRKSN